MRDDRPRIPTGSKRLPKQPLTPSEPLNGAPRPFYGRFRNVLFLGAGAVAVLLAALFVYGRMAPAPQRLTQRDIDVAVARALASATPRPSYASEAYAVIRPSLVSVETRVLKDGIVSEGSIGAGVVIDDSGVILTSLHLFKGAVEVRVVFADGTDSEASVIATQSENDLMVLQAHEIPDDLVPATLTSSRTLHVGDEVIAMGDPFGLGSSLSAGVVSGLGRSLLSAKAGATLTNLIQFDAAVNPGNSGGPLVNRQGEVVGIVTGLFNPSDQDVFIGIAFAVPIESAAAAAGSPWY